MALPKPSSHINWTDGAPVKVQEPTSGKKLLGWAFKERPPFEFMNWLFFRLDEWAKYFESVTDELSIQKQEYDAVIGTGGTHADFNAYEADVNVALLKNVLITTPLTLATNQVVNQSGVRFTFKPQAIITKAVGCTKGILFTGERVTVVGGRFVGFNVAGDIALELSAATKNCLVTQASFVDCLTEVNDLGSNNSLTSNISEVL